MIPRFLKRRRDEGRLLHDAVMAGALAPSLYLAGIAEDTFEGRFDMVSLHAILVMRRLRAIGERGRAVADSLYRALFDGLDYALREEGVGDSSIARKVRGHGEVFFGLARALDAALDVPAPDEAVAGVLARNGIGQGDPAGALAYVLSIEARLADLPDASVLSGAIDWPEVPSGG